MREPRTRVRLALFTVAVAAALAGCGRVEQLPLTSQPMATDPSAAPSEAAPDGPFSGTPEPADPVPTATALPDADASPCSAADRVTAALRRDRNLLPSGVTPKIVVGPLCAGGWQYTVMNVPGREALQVVTRGDSALTVVTAGTYVCIPEVVGAAPPGIVSAAHCR